MHDLSQHGLRYVAQFLREQFLGSADTLIHSCSDFKGMTNLSACLWFSPVPLLCSCSKAFCTTVSLRRLSKLCRSQPPRTICPCRGAARQLLRRSFPSSRRLHFKRLSAECALVMHTMQVSASRPLLMKPLPYIGNRLYCAWNYTGPKCNEGKCSPPHGDKGMLLDQHSAGCVR